MNQGVLSNLEPVFMKDKPALLGTLLVIVVVSSCWGDMRMVSHRRKKRPPCQTQR